jgi:hypothetical protein
MATCRGRMMRLRGFGWNVCASMGCGPIREDREDGEDNWQVTHARDTNRGLGKVMSPYALP